jgi:DNA-directed RNA polymerase subunit RPC12/RpoP
MKHRAKDLRNRKYLCVECDKPFRDKYTLTKHLNSTVHNPKPKIHYSCDLCGFKSHIKTQLKIHNKTKKHRNAVEAQAEIEANKARKELEQAELKLEQAKLKLEQAVQKLEKAKLEI